MCLPEKSKTKEINVKRQQELLQVIEDTRRRMQAEALLASNNIFCIWPGICLTHSVADLARNNNNNYSHTNQRNNNIQQRTRSRSHQRHETQRNFPGTLSRHRLQTSGNSVNYHRGNPMISDQEENETTLTSNEFETTNTAVESVNNILTIQSFETTHFQNIETISVEDNTSNDLFSPFQQIQQFEQLPIPNQIESEYPMMQILPENVQNSNQLLVNNVSHTTDAMFGGVLPLLNIFQFFRNI